MLSAIVARSTNNIIGVHNDLPWDLPDDRAYFRDITRGHNVIMGRKTAESIVARLGHGLPGRENILVTRDPDYTLEGFTVVHTIEDAIKAGGLDGFVIGGEQIYTQALPYCDRLYITEVDVIADGDAHFAEFDRDEWELVSSTPHTADDKHAYAFNFTVLDRKKPT
jgi:dihydrofolate reductase